MEICAIKLYGFDNKGRLVNQLGDNLHYYSIGNVNQYVVHKLWVNLYSIYHSTLGFEQTTEQTAKFIVQNIITTGFCPYFPAFSAPVSSQCSYCAAHRSCCC